MSADGVPPVQQERGLPAAMEGLPGQTPFSSGYRYVIFHFWFITITRRSLSVAIAASCLTFVALQVCSALCQQETETHLSPLSSTQSSLRRLIPIVRQTP